MRFFTGNTERMRIDSSGNLLVGKTSTASNVVGAFILNNGLIRADVDGGVVNVMNRKTNDGDIAVFQKDGTTVGSIGAKSGDIYIGTGDTGLRFNDGDNAVYAADTTTGSASDGNISLGVSSARFKDLYLSGGVYLGGTGSANKLDDYEEGTWTPKFTDHTGSDRFSTYSFQIGTYTKIGNTCLCSFDVSGDTGAVTSGTYLGIGNLPFNVQSGGNATSIFNASYLDNLGYSTIQGGFANPSPNFIYLVSSGTSYVGPASLTSGSRMIGGFVYLTA
jgi:hypothetical protein